MLFIEEPFKTLWKNQDDFSRVKLICDGSEKKDIFRNKEGRLTVRFKAENKSYFLKYHNGVGWKEIIKNLFQLRLPVLGASNEYYAAKKLQQLKVDTLNPVVFNNKGFNPATQQSYLITDDLIDTTSLEDICRSWADSRPNNKFKQALIKKVALAAKAMHEAGINHRDFYICHFLLENAAEQKIQNNKPFACYLIDLHRCQMRSKVPKRWLVKDLGGLLYSTFDIGLNRNDYFFFLKHYTGQSLQQLLANPLWQQVLSNAEKLYEKDFKKTAPKIFKKSARG